MCDHWGEVTDPGDSGVLSKCLQSKKGEGGERGWAWGGERAGGPEGCRGRVQVSGCPLSMGLSTDDYGVWLKCHSFLGTFLPTKEPRASVLDTAILKMNMHMFERARGMQKKSRRGSRALAWSQG